MIPRSLQRLGKGLGAMGRSVGSKEYSKEYSQGDYRHLTSLRLLPATHCAGSSHSERITDGDKAFPRPH